MRDRGVGATVIANLRWGATLGLTGAAGLSLFVLVLAALRGSTEYPQYGMTTWSVIESYFVVGLPAGLLVGLLRPLLRWRVGGALVGYLAAAVIYCGIGIIMDGVSRTTLIVGALCGIGGAVAGAMWWPDGPWAARRR